MNETIHEKNIKRYPKKIIVSFQMTSIIRLMISQLMAVQLTHYYDAVLHFDLGYMAIASVIFAVFNAINDPILGYFSDKPHKFTKKWGKRFPLILLGGIPWCFMIIFFFSIPNAEEIGQLNFFFNYLIILILNDTFFALYSINQNSLFPDKFRHTGDRKYAGLIITIFETTGVILGFLIPILIVDSIGGDTGYVIQAYIVAFISFIFFLLAIPGLREDKDLRERREKIEAQKPDPFISGMKVILKNKQFIGYICLYGLYFVTMGTIMASIPYLVEDILHLDEIGQLIIIFYILGVLIGAPIWYKLSFKLGIKKVALLGGIGLGSMGIPFIFVPEGDLGVIVTIIILLIAGFVDGALISMYMPIFSSIIDIGAIETGKRQEGLYNGVSAFITSFGVIIQPAIFYFIQTFTGYNTDLTAPTPEELLGLRLQISLIPMLLMLTGVFIFRKFYTLSPKEIEENSKKLLELGL